MVNCHKSVVFSNVNDNFKYLNVNVNYISIFLEQIKILKALTMRAGIPL